MMIACGRPSRQKLAASSTEPTKSTSMLMLRSASRISTRTSRREATTSTWLPASAFELPDCDDAVVDLGRRQAFHLLAGGLRKLEHQRASCRRRPCGRRPGPWSRRSARSGARCSESRRGGAGGDALVDLVGRAVREAAGQPRMRRPGLEVDRELDVCVGVGQRPVERRVEQAEEQRAVDDDARRLQLRLEGDAARLRLAACAARARSSALPRAAAPRATGAPAGGEARQLLADHADLARLLDLVAQRAQAGAVDLAGRGRGRGCARARRSAARRSRRRPARPARASARRR